MMITFQIGDRVTYNELPGSAFNGVIVHVHDIGYRIKFDTLHNGDFDITGTQLKRLEHEGGNEAYFQSRLAMYDLEPIS